KVVPAPQVWIVAVPETTGVHWKTRSGELAELPQLPANMLVPLVVPLNVPPCAAMTVGLLQPPTSVTGAAAPWHTPIPSVLKLVPAPHVWIVAVPETVGVHWKTFSGEVSELPQLPVNRFVPLVVPVNVPPCAAMTVGLVQPPTRVTGAAAPWQTPRPSLLQRM